MVASDLISKIRNIVADPDATRWPDSRVLSLIDEAQKDICRTAQPLRAEQNIILHSGQSNYTLPNDFYRLTRAVYEDVELVFKTKEVMNNVNPSWRSSEGDPRYVVFDGLNRGLVSISPIPTFEEPDVFDITTAPRVAINYSKIPEDVTDVSDVLDLPDLYGILIEFYVTGRLFREDLDAQNRAFGNEQLQLYSQKLFEMIKESSRDFTNNVNIYEVPYRLGV